MNKARKLLFKEGFKSVSYPCSATIKYDGTFQEIRAGIGVSKRGVKKNMPFLNLPSDITFYAELIRGRGLNRYEEFASDSTESFNVVLLDYESASSSYEQRINNMLMYCADNTRVFVPDMITLCNNEKELKNFFYQAVKKGYEGIVAKCNGYRVKIKADYTIDLVVKGIAKGRSACLLGTIKENYCHTSMLGKKTLLDAIRGLKIIGGTQEDYLFEPKIVVEIKHYGIIRTRGKIAFRNPDIKRVRFDKRAEDIKEVV